MGQHDERRAYRRADVKLPVSIYAGNSKHLLAQGASVNISPGGVLVECSDEKGLAAVKSNGLYLCFSNHQTHPSVSGHAARVARRLGGAPPRYAVEFEQPSSLLIVPELVGRHGSVLAVKQRILDLAGYDVNVMVHGESGTGKNVVAGLIHRYSPRCDKPIIRVNCPSIPESLFESQLFGSEKGAYTGASAPRPGLFRVASGGTVLLDEITAIPPALQAKLLEVIEAQEFIPVGGDRPVQVDVRVVATTNEDLDECLAEGTLRPDLYYRLNEVDIELPPLRERHSDIPLLADYFMRKQCDYFRKAYKPLEPRVIEHFMRHRWPGNVRELQNTVKRGILMGQFEPTTPDTGRRTPTIATNTEVPRAEKPVQEPAGEAPGDKSLASVRKAAERAAIAQALEMSRFDRSEAARKLGISTRCLRRKTRQFFGALNDATQQPFQMSGHPPVIDEALQNGEDLATTVAVAEQCMIGRVLRSCASRTQAAAHLGVSYSTLRRKISEYNLT